MKAWKVYKIKYEDNEGVWETAVPAPSKNAAKEVVSGTKIISLKEEDIRINLVKLTKTLEEAGYGKDEIDILTCLVTSTEIWSI